MVRGPWEVVRGPWEVAIGNWVLVASPLISHSPTLPSLFPESCRDFFKNADIARHQWIGRSEILLKLCNWQT